MMRVATRSTHPPLAIYLSIYRRLNDARGHAKHAPLGRGGLVALDSRLNDARGHAKHARRGPALQRRHACVSMMRVATRSTHWEQWFATHKDSPSQ